ncbi:hypothetical protein V5O48_018089 [Marasmius crinis-equi]|uniref:Methyltransferase n=1 Tax=Marasmius crinis-equi TaxID=585013 RepID=A0ABR3EM52_9AGAR
MLALTLDLHFLFMTVTNGLSANTVTGDLFYFTPPPDGGKPRRYLTKPPEGEPVSNHENVKREMHIENVRGKEKDFSLDTTGFQLLLDEPTKIRRFDDDGEIEREYYRESAEIIKRVAGASKVVIIDHTIRRRVEGEKGIEDPRKRVPASIVHVDQTPAAAIDRVHRHISPPEEAERLLRKRFQIINLWRPIKHPAIDMPLAFCDFRSIDPKEDLVPVQLVFPGRLGETYGVKWNEEHQWKYMKGMDVDEAALIKCYDSIQDGSVATLTPHTAFKDPSTPPESPPRESIELRALVFYD